MNKKSLVILLTAALIFAMSVINIAMAAGGAGTASDPVVTKSYVDDLVKELRAEMEKSSSGSASATPASSDGATFIVVEVQAGQSVIGKEGTEMVLRSGSATIIDNGAVGVSDLTAGADLMSPKAVTKNHLLLIPRDDGRGIKCNTHAYVMVKGGYTVQ